MDRDAREQAEKILRDAGVSAEAIAAKRNIDARLDGFGLNPSRGAPTLISPGRRVDVGFGIPKIELRANNEQRIDQIVRQTVLTGTSDEGGAVSAILLGDGVGGAPPRVVPTENLPTHMGEATWEPTDLLPAQSVASLATTASGGTEVKFNYPGIVYVGPGAMGCYWARALGASQNIRWNALMAAVRLAYSPKIGLFFGTNAIGGVATKGVLTLAFYKLPDKYHSGKNSSWKAWHKQVGEWTEGSGDSAATGVAVQSLSTGPTNGTDVTLGTFSDAGAGTQIFKVGTNFPVAGAVVQGAVILNASNANTDAIWVAETTALAVASNGALGALGQDSNNRAVGTKLFMLANSGTQVLGARYRS